MSALVYKQIKPKRLNEAAMRAALGAGASHTADDIEADFFKTVASWNKKPVFEKLTDLGPPITILVGTDDEIYAYVDKGTPAHDIYAGYYTGKSAKKVLAFSSKSTPKTIPGVIGSSAGGTGAVDTFRPYVRHPGTKARKFSEEITKIWKPKFRTRMEQAMKNAAKASGHAL